LTDQLQKLIFANCPEDQENYHFTSLKTDFYEVNKICNLAIVIELYDLKNKKDFGTL